MELKAKANYTSDVEESIISLQERMEQFSRGRKKASVMAKKGLLKNLLFAVVVTPKGLLIEYRLKDGLNSDAARKIAPEAIKAQNNVIEMEEKRRAKSSGSFPDSESEDSADSNFRHKKTNLVIGSVNPSNVGNQKLQVVGIGSQPHLLGEPSQPAVTIELPESERQAINLNFAELYKKGLSLRDIARQTGRAKSVIRRSLLAMGIELRPHASTSFFSNRETSGKTNILPPYGFCYFQGQITPDPREYENLMLIHQLWKSKVNPNRISDTLIEKKIPPRIAKSWNRNSVINILNRFEKKQIILKGGQLELR